MTNALNLQEIDQEQALNLSKFFIKSGGNLFLFGKSGIGKTQIAIQAAKETNYKVNYINLSVIERPDLIGYPDMQADGDMITFKSPYFLPKLIEGSAPDNIFLFDEVDKAPSEITAPLLEILQFKKINGTPVNAAACILTGNLFNERAYSNQISSALLDRGSKYILNFSMEKWLDWAKINNIHDLILGFLRSNPEYACGKTEDTNYASPSPRAWTLASDAIFKAKALKIVDIETVSQIISGFVGVDAGIKFKIYYNYYRQLEPYIFSLIESGNLTIDFNKLMLTEKLVFVISACYYAKQKILQPFKGKNKFLPLENLCNFFLMNKIEREMMVIGLCNSFSFEMIAKYKLYTCKVFFDMFNKLNENLIIKR
jgi:hypothetical protein